MYALHPQKRTNPPTIYIFVEVRPGKEAVAACQRHGSGTGQTSSAAATLMADKVEVYEHLKEKHRDRVFSDEQIHRWAYLIATKQHDSQEHPLAKRFFGKSASTKNKRRHEDSDGEDAPTVELASSSRAAENAPGRERMKETRSCANCMSCVTFVTLEGGGGAQEKSLPESGQSWQRFSALLNDVFYEVPFSVYVSNPICVHSSVASLVSFWFLLTVFRFSGVTVLFAFQSRTLEESSASAAPHLVYF